MKKLDMEDEPIFDNNLIYSDYCERPSAIWYNDKIMVVFASAGAIKRIVVNPSGTVEATAEVLLDNPYDDLAGYVEPSVTMLDDTIKIAARNATTNKIVIFDYAVEQLKDNFVEDSGTGNTVYNTIYHNGEAIVFSVLVAEGRWHWTFRVEQDGNYDLSAGIGISAPSAAYNNQVKYTIVDESGSTDVYINQKEYAQENPFGYPYMPLGTFAFVKDTDYTVSLSAGPSGDTSYDFVTADTLKVTYNDPVELFEGYAPSIQMDDSYIYYAYHYLEWVRVAKTDHDGGNVIGPYRKYPDGKNVSLFYTIDNELVYLYERENCIYYAKTQTDWTVVQSQKRLLIPENLYIPGKKHLAYYWPSIIIDHAGRIAISYENNEVNSDIYFYRTDNIIFPLEESDFSVVYNSINYRLGMIILPAAIATDSVVTCSADYYYCTIQATGIETPIIEFNVKDTENRFESLITILSLLAPNYFIRADANNKIRGSYLNQKVVADKSLTNVSVSNYANDKDIFTRAKIFGQNANPVNLCLDAKFQDETVIEGEANNLILAPLASSIGT